MDEVAAAKLAAKRLYEKYCCSKKAFTSCELASLMTDTYGILKIPFKPTEQDVKEYCNILDADSDGEVTLNDFETRAIEYLCGGVKTQKSSTSINSSRQSKQGHNQSLGHQETAAQEKQNAHRFLRKEQSNNEIKNKVLSESSAKTMVERNANTQSNRNYEQLSKAEASANLVYFRQQDILNPKPKCNSPNFFSQGLNGVSTVYSIEKSYEGGLNSCEYSFVESGFQFQTKQFIQLPCNLETNDNKQWGHWGFASGCERGKEQKNRGYSEAVSEYLKVIGQIFIKYADPISFIVPREQVANLLTDTYYALGQQAQFLPENEIDAWMRLYDLDKDGKVGFQEYEEFVVSSLESSGLSLHQ